MMRSYNYESPLNNFLVFHHEMGQEIKLFLLMIGFSKKKILFELNRFFWPKSDASP